MAKLIVYNVPMQCTQMNIKFISFEKFNSFLIANKSPKVMCKISIQYNAHY